MGNHKLKNNQDRLSTILRQIRESKVKPKNGTEQFTCQNTETAEYLLFPEAAKRAANLAHSKTSSWLFSLPLLGNQAERRKAQTQILPLSVIKCLYH